MAIRSWWLGIHWSWWEVIWAQDILLRYNQGICWWIGQGQDWESTIILRVGSESEWGWIGDGEHLGKIKSGCKTLEFGFGKSQDYYILNVQVEILRESWIYGIQERGQAWR